MLDSSARFLNRLLDELVNLTERENPDNPRDTVWRGVHPNHRLGNIDEVVHSNLLVVPEVRERTLEVLCEPETHRSERTALCVLGSLSFCGSEQLVIHAAQLCRKALRARGRKLVLEDHELHDRVFAIVADRFNLEVQLLCCQRPNNRQHADERGRLPLFEVG